MSPVVATLLLPTAKQPKPTRLKSLLIPCLSSIVKGDDCDSQDQACDPSESPAAAPSKKHLSRPAASSKRFSLHVYSSDHHGQPHSSRCHSHAAKSPGCASLPCSNGPAVEDSSQPTSSCYAGAAQLSSCQQRPALPAAPSAVIENIAMHYSSSTSSNTQPLAAAADTAAAAVTIEQQQQASAGLDALNDEQLLLLSRLPISQDAVRQCSLAQLEHIFTSASTKQQLGRGGHSVVIQATIPWSVSAAAAAAEITSTAAAAGVGTDGLAAAVAAGLPVVIKHVAYERYEGSTLFNMDGRLAEEQHCKLVGTSPYFPVLYRAIHTKRRSYLIFTTVTAHSVNLAEYVQQRLQSPAAGLKAPRPGLHCSMQQQERQTLSSDGGTSQCPCIVQPKEAALSAAAPSQQQQQQQHSLCSMNWHHAVLQILQDVAEGLNHLHGLGLLHLDVKAGNIIMREGGHAYLIDLGVACEVGETLEHHGIVGTEMVMDPQIWHDTELLGAYQIYHDYYSLGAVALYLALKGCCNLFIPIQNELEQAILLEEQSGKALESLTTNSGLQGCSFLGFGFSRSRRAIIAAKHIVKARQLLSNAGVGRGISDLVITLMGPANRRPTSHQQVEALLEHAKLCIEPEQNDAWGGEDSRNSGIMLLAVLAAVTCAILWVVC